MIIKGKYNEAKVFSDELEEQTREQIQTLCDQWFLKDAKIRVMPDAHAGMGSTIGTTLTVTDKVVPNLVGVDIGCGMLTVPIGKKEVDLRKLDLYIRGNIPSGFKNNKKPQIDYVDEIRSLRGIYALDKSAEEFNKALGSLGGGNHFIEIDRDDEGEQYLIFHSGSRNLGNRIARHYQKIAEKNLKDQSEIPKDLCYLEGQQLEDYLHDMDLIQGYARVNREVMARKVLEEFFNRPFTMEESFHTIHNYIDLKENILRKGAVSAKKGEKVLIPINMKDGSLLGEGRGNEDWNYSAPHGAGRLMSRREAKRQVSLEAFKKSMKGIYSSSVSSKTMDEAPMAYKPIEDILKHIDPTLVIVKHIKPIYNFKA